jgi:hypothetical protein
MKASEGTPVIELPSRGTVAIEPWSLRFMVCTAKVSIAGRTYEVDLEFARDDPREKWKLATERPREIDIRPADFSFAPYISRNAEGKASMDHVSMTADLSAQRPNDKLVKATRRVIKKAVLEWVATHPKEMREMQRRAMLEDTRGVVGEINEVIESFYSSTALVTDLTDRWQWTKYHGRRLGGGGADKWGRALRSAERAIAELERMAKWIGGNQRKSVPAAA